MVQDSKKRKPQKKAVQKKEPTLVYVGPNITGDLLLNQFSTFRNGLPGHIKEKVESDKNFSRLFIPVEKLAKARDELKKPSSTLGRILKAILQAYTIKKRGTK
ncbi:MAG: hypothetical protein GY729_07005 [Desulfobacteraceae bacterium]|nr:hypothetical protein [Desulfobacteraceae bacterium]